MLKKITTIVSIVIFLLLISLIFIIIEAGKGLEINTAVTATDNKAGFDSNLASIFSNPVAIFILQLLIIIIASQVFGYLFKKIRQPAVMGEIVAGILLGPSLVGNLFPEFTAFIFPVNSLGNLQMLSQIGLVLFMFVIGMELDLEVIKKSAKSAVYISYASIIVPYVLGIVLSYFLYRTYAPPNVPFYAFALFIGIAMSITAFPVLARVIKEKKLSNTKLGTVAITCAAVDDVTGWCLLAFVIAIVKAGSINSSIFIILQAIAYILFMFFIVKKILHKFIRRNNSGEEIKPVVMAIVFIVMLLSAYISEIIGIHALFGAFLAGVIMPIELNFRKIIIDKIEDISIVLLLPLFFVFTGLRTEIGLLNTSGLWLSCALIIMVAIVGKFGGSAIAARIQGESLHDSLAIGALMNTRGLMELIILNIGYDLGILTPEVFAMMVVMALVTTLMTGPLLDIIGKYYGKKTPNSKFQIPSFDAAQKEN